MKFQNDFLNLNYIIENVLYLCWLDLVTRIICACERERERERKRKKKGRYCLGKSIAMKTWWEKLQQFAIFCKAANFQLYLAYDTLMFFHYQEMWLKRKEILCTDGMIFFSIFRKIWKWNIWQKNGNFKYRERVFVWLVGCLRGSCGRNKPPKNRDILVMNLWKEKHDFVYDIS